MATKKVGVWLVGALGQVGTCLMLGCEALVRGWYPPLGLVTELQEFEALHLLPLQNLVFGGYEVRSVTLEASAQEIYEKSGSLSYELCHKLRDWMQEQNTRIQRGYAIRKEGVATLWSSTLPSYSSLEIVEKVSQDLYTFQKNHDLETVIMVNIASTERPFHLPENLQTISDFDHYLQSGGEIPISSLYAYGALKQGFPYINFTPSTGVNLTPLLAFAQEKNIPISGQDGKTGETLLKTTLAPMFVARHLKVLSWEGYNLLGNRDGQVLEDPQNNQSKVKNKDEALRHILKDPETHSRVRIDYVPSLDDWKTAWDFIHFQGFLQTKMSLQFTWQGCDSILAAPLILDLLRLTHLAYQRKEGSILTHLACFFKNPLGTSEQAFLKQFDLLLDYVHHAKQSAP